MANEDQVQTFTTVCGADSRTARAVLESFGNDLDRAVNFFLENGAESAAQVASFADNNQQPAAAAAAEPVIPDEDDDEPILVPSQSPEAVGASSQQQQDRRNQGWLEEERALQEALRASKMSAGGGAGPSSARASTPANSASQRPSSGQVDSDTDLEEYEPEVESDVEMDTEEEYMRKLAAAQEAAVQRQRRSGRQAAAGRAGPSAGPASFALDDSDDEGPRIRRIRPSGAAADAAQHLQDLNALGQRLGIDPTAAMGGGGMFGPAAAAGGRAADSNGAGPSGSGDAGFPAGRDSGLPDMPAGVDVEEARMLEAAMLGIPYTGRIPDFANDGGAAAGGFGSRLGGGAAAEPLSPGVRAHRAIREEQDWAFQESLQRDREKAQAEEAAAAAARAGAERQQREAEEAAAAVAKAAADHEAALAHKSHALPDEPQAGSDGAITVLIRLPSGRRLSRRFLTSHQLSSLYDFVDTSDPGDDVRPSTYCLVTNMPRKVYEESSEQTLADAGLTQKQEMLLLEPKA